VREQALSRGTALQPVAAAASWIQASAAFAGRLNQLEDRLHNPKAEVTYDILAQQGGTRLYSRLIALYDFLREADGVPTRGMREIFGQHTKELDALEAEWKALLATDLAALNASARELGLSYLAAP
jgi:hypothetical protein